MKIRTLQHGQSLIEIIFAISIFVIGIVTIGYLTIDAFGSVQSVSDRTQSRLLAAEGIEALISIRDNGFEKLAEGTYGLEVDQGFWKLVPNAVTVGKFTRTITIKAIDTDMVEVQSLVLWNVFGGRERSNSYTTFISNWTQTNGQAGDLGVYTQNAALISFDKEVIGIFLQNEGSEDITITKMALTWGTAALLTQVAISDVDVWSASSSQPVAPGSEVDILDYTLQPNSGFHNISALEFDASIAGSDLVVIFTLADESRRSVYISL